MKLTLARAASGSGDAAAAGAREAAVAGVATAAEVHAVATACIAILAATAAALAAHLVVVEVLYFGIGLDILIKTRWRLRIEEFQLG